MGSLQSPSGIKVFLKCKDGSVYKVSKAIALQMQNIKHLIRDDHETSNIPVRDDITGPVLAKLIEYCVCHASEGSSSVDNLKSFDEEFVKKQHQATLCDLLSGVHKLGVGGRQLTELLCQAIADVIKDMRPEEIRKMFNIKNDFTPEEEEAQIRNEFKLLFF